MTSENFKHEIKNWDMDHLLDALILIGKCQWSCQTTSDLDKLQDAVECAEAVKNEIKKRVS